MFKGTDVLPTKNPKNYSLARSVTLVDYKTLATQYSPRYEVAKGRLIVDLKKNRAGTCINIGFVKGKDGERCTIKGNRRNHHADRQDCVAIPPLNTFVQDKDGVWHMLCNADARGAGLYQCFGPLNVDNGDKSKSKKKKKKGKAAANKDKDKDKAGACAQHAYVRAYTHWHTRACCRTFTFGRLRLVAYVRSPTSNMSVRHEAAESQDKDKDKDKAGACAQHAYVCAYTR